MKARSAISRVDISLRLRATEISNPSFLSARLTGCGKAVFDLDALIVKPIKMSNKLVSDQDIVRNHDASNTQHNNDSYLDLYIS
jgi:hypothetical protein